MTLVTDNINSIYQLDTQYNMYVHLTNWCYSQQMLRKLIYNINIAM